MIRAARPGDIDAIVRLGIEALNNDPYEELVISESGVREAATLCVSSSQCFAWVAEEDGEVKGAVVALVQDMLFYERKQASVLMFWCHIPGDGIKLIRQFLRWARSRPIIKMIEFTLERNADPRIGKMLSRLGLKTALPIYIQVK